MNIFGGMNWVNCPKLGSRRALPPGQPHLMPGIREVRGQGYQILCYHWPPGLFIPVLGKDK